MTLRPLALVGTQSATGHCSPRAVSRVARRSDNEPNELTYIEMDTYRANS